MSILNRIFAVFPETELMARKIYKSSNKETIDFLKKIKQKLVHPEKEKSLEGEQWVTTNELENILANAGIKNDDILIAHTSIDGLSQIKAKPTDILDMLLSLVKNGTLVLPTFPHYKKKNGKTPTYDYANFIAWTGFLPNLFMRERNAITSRLPMNTLSAYGKFANEMFYNENLATTTYGNNTAWEFCAKRHAKVLFLGVEPFHSISEAHIAEDILNSNYPIKGWHETRKFMIGTKGVFNEKEYSIRKDIWSMYSVENYHQRRLLKTGILRNVSNNTTKIFIIDDLETYVNYMIDNIQKKDLVCFKVPKKYWR